MAVHPRRVHPRQALTKVVGPAGGVRDCPEHRVGRCRAAYSRADSRHAAPRPAGQIPHGTRSRRGLGSDRLGGSAIRMASGAALRRRPGRSACMDADAAVGPESRGGAGLPSRRDGQPRVPGCAAAVVPARGLHRALDADAVPGAARPRRRATADAGRTAASVVSHALRRSHRRRQRGGGRGPVRRVVRTPRSR